jgi:hypothetical protein
MQSARSGDLPKLAAPARRALANASITSLAELCDRTEEDIASLHGMGPKATAVLREALERAGLAFARS